MEDPFPEKFGSVGERLVPFGGAIVREMNQVVDGLGTEAADEERLFDTFDKAIHEQPSAVADGVDMAPIKAVEPDFDSFNFRTIARETFIKMREARGSKSKQEGDPLLSPTMQADLDNVIDGDVAAHRHHILPGLELEQATIVSAAVAGGHERLGVRFVLDAEEMERDDATQAIVSGDQLTRRWAELWQFERDPSLDTATTDQQHILSFGPDGWLIAHRGWVVTGIQRLDEALAQPKQPPAP